MDKIAIYDMDRTITRIGTFTPFLFFVARRRFSRLLRLPLFFLAMLAYPLRLLDRKGLKQVGFRLVLGNRASAQELARLAGDYADHVCRSNLHANARARIAADKAEGCMLVMATASPDFYATAIGERLGFDHIIATRQERLEGGDYSHRIVGDNCYGPAKLERIEQWLPVPREASEIRFYSDHPSDAPVLEWADSAIAANPDARLRALAEARGWRIMSFA